MPLTAEIAKCLMEMRVSATKDTRYERASTGKWFSIFELLMICIILGEAIWKRRKYFKRGVAKRCEFRRHFASVGMRCLFKGWIIGCEFLVL